LGNDKREMESLKRFFDKSWIDEKREGAKRVH